MAFICDNALAILACPADGCAATGPGCRLHNGGHAPTPPEGAALTPFLKIRIPALPAACAAIALPGLGPVVVLLLLLLLWTKAALAASFDCTRSKTRVE